MNHIDKAVLFAIQFDRISIKEKSVNIFYKKGVYSKPYRDLKIINVDFKGNTIILIGNHTL